MRVSCVTTEPHRSVNGFFRHTISNKFYGTFFYRNRPYVIALLWILKLPRYSQNNLRVSEKKRSVINEGVFMRFAGHIKEARQLRGAGG